MNLKSGARFVKWGLGLFLFGVFLTFGVLGHYWHGASHPVGDVFTHNITLWWGCPWTLAVAVIQLGGLGMAALGVGAMLSSRAAPSEDDFRTRAALYICIGGLLGIFAVGYIGYYAFDAIWPGFYYVPVAAGKNAWLGAQALCIFVFFIGALLAFGRLRRSLDALAA